MVKHRLICAVLVAVTTASTLGGCAAQPTAGPSAGRYTGPGHATIVLRADGSATFSAVPYKFFGGGSKDSGTLATGTATWSTMSGDGAVYILFRDEQGTPPDLDSAGWTAFYGAEPKPAIWFYIGDPDVNDRFTLTKH